MTENITWKHYRHKAKENRRYEFFDRLTNSANLRHQCSVDRNHNPTAKFHHDTCLHLELHVFWHRERLLDHVRRIRSAYAFDASMIITNVLLCNTTFVNICKYIYISFLDMVVHFCGYNVEYLILHHLL